jgi:hypothetical protein
VVIEIEVLKLDGLGVQLGLRLECRHLALKGGSEEHDGLRSSESNALKTCPGGAYIPRRASRFARWRPAQNRGAARQAFRGNAQREQFLRRASSDTDQGGLIGAELRESN